MKLFLKRYLPYYKNYKMKFGFAIIGMIMVSIGTSGTAYVIKPVLDDIFINKDQQMLFILPFVVIILYSLKGFGRFIQTYYITYIGTDIIRITRDKFLNHILTRDIEFFNNKHGGELISRVSGDIEAIQKAISTSIAALIMESLTILALIGVVIYQSPKLAFFGLIILPLILYPLSKLARKMKILSRKGQAENAVLVSIMSELFNNIELIIASNMQKIQTKKFSDQNKHIFNINMKGVKTNALVSPMMEIVGAISAALVIAIGGVEVINDSMSIGAFFSFLTALFMLYTPIKKISSVYNQFQIAIAANERITDIFRIQSRIKEGFNNLEEKIKLISFNNISLKYGSKIALKNVNIKAEIGQKIALVGDSGGGKSSLVNLMLRFYDPYKGTVKFNNQNINTLKFNNLRNIVAIVTQRIYIFNDTVANNISFGLPVDEKKIINALKQAYALDFIDKLKNGIHTVLDEFGTNLSGGQRQRIAIARALYKQPQILIFDEATSALDNESESIITKVLDEVSKDRITFIIAHRLSTIKNADLISVFKEGEIICTGKENELLKKCPEFQRLYNLASL